MEEASGSNPLGSTTLRKAAPACCFLVVEAAGMFLAHFLELKTAEAGSRTLSRFGAKRTNILSDS